MNLKCKFGSATFLLILVLSLLTFVPIGSAQPPVYGPKMDEFVGRYIRGTSAQRMALEQGEVDIWGDIREPAVIRALEDPEGFKIVMQQYAFLFYYISFNFRMPQSAWRGGAEAYQVPISNTKFRHAVAHAMNKEATISTIFEFAGTPISSVVPEAQSAYFNPACDKHPYNPGDPTATTEYPADHSSCGILREAGFTYDAGAYNPATGGHTGNWIDPATGELIPLINALGVLEAESYSSWMYWEMFCDQFQAVGLPIKHEELAFQSLIDLSDAGTYDMYTLGWGIGRFPDSLYYFFHSSQAVIGGYNRPGVQDPDFDALLETINYDTNKTKVWLATLEFQELMLDPELEPDAAFAYIPTHTRADVWAYRKKGALGSPPAPDDTLVGIVNSKGYGPDNDWTNWNMHWQDLGIGGRIKGIIATPIASYNPSIARTVDEWYYLGRIFDGLIAVNPYTHEDKPWVAYDWDVQYHVDMSVTIDSDPRGGRPWFNNHVNDVVPMVDGMITTFNLREDVYWHDGVQYTGHDVEFALEYLRDWQMPRAMGAWYDLLDVQVGPDDFTVKIYQNASSLFLFYDSAGWPTMFPKHIYEGTGDPYDYRPWEEAHPTIAGLTQLIGTGHMVHRCGDYALGGYVYATAYSTRDLGYGAGGLPDPTFVSSADPLTTSWFKSTDDVQDQKAEMFHRAGDYNSNGEVNIFDKSPVQYCWGSLKYDDPETPWDDTLHWDELADFNEDEKNSITDVVIMNLRWGLKREY